MDIIEIRLDTENGSYVCETYKNTSIQISRRVQSLDVLESGQGSQATYTKQQFTCPLQGELFSALGDITDPKSDFRIDIRKSIPGSIIVAGRTAYEGSFNITSASYNPISKAKEVDLIFKGKESSIKSQTNNVLLKDMLSDYTIPFTYSDVTDSLEQVTGNTLADLGYIFFLADLGQNFVLQGGNGTEFDNPSNPFLHDNFKPGISWKYIFDAIESELDLTIEWDSDIDDLINDQVLFLHNNDKYIPELDTSPLNGTGFMTYSTFYTVSTNLSTYQKIDYDSKTVYSDDYFDLTNDVFTAPYALSPQDGNRYRVSTRIRVEGDGSPGVGETDTVRVTVAMFRNNTLYAIMGAEEFSVPDNTPFNELLNIERESAFTASSGDIFDIRVNAVVSSSTGAPASISQYNINGDGTFFEITQMPQTNPTSNILVGANIDPEVTVWDTIKHIITQCNGIVENTLSGFSIKPWEKWIDEGDDLDLNQYGIDSSKDIQFVPTGVTGAKSIEFKYAESDDFYSEQVRAKTGRNYGAKIIEDTGSDFATETYEVESPFALLIPVPIESTNTNIPKLVDDNGDVVFDKMGVTFYTGALFEEKVAVKDKSSSAWGVFFHPIMSNWLPFDGGFSGNDLAFGKGVNYFAATGYPNNNLYNRFWKRYIQESFSTQAMRVNMSIYLPKFLASQLTLNERVYFNGYALRINALENFSINDNEPIDVEMMVRTVVENIDIAPFYPYDVISSIVQWKDSSNNNDLADASGQTPSDVKASCIAYGFFYDSVNNIGVEQGKLIVT